MVQKERKLRRGDPQVVKTAVSAILRGGDYSEELRAAVDMHLETDGLSGPFQKAFLRACRLNLSLGTSQTLINALRAEPDQKGFTAAFSKSFKRLDLALAFNNLQIASSVLERLLDKFDQMTGKDHRAGKYATLEQEVGAALAAGEWAALKHKVIEASAYLGSDPVTKSISVGNTLGLSQRGQDQLLELYASVIEEIEDNLNSIQALKNTLKPSRESATDLQKLDLELANDFGTALAQIFGTGEIGGKRNIKAVLIYPLLIATLNPRRKRDPNLSGALISKIVGMEPDQTLRSMMEVMDYPLSPGPYSGN